MSRNQILDGVRHVLRTKLRIEQEIDGKTELVTDLELDSMDQLTLVVALENHFRVCFEPGDEVDITTVDDVVTAIARSGVADAPA